MPFVEGNRLLLRSLSVIDHVQCVIERVLRAAKELRYQPNARARAFRLGRTNVIGLYAGYGYINVRSPFFTEIVSGLQEGCEAVRKDLLLHGIFHGTSPDDIYLELADGHIDGATGTLRLDGYGNVQRTPAWSTFSAGVATPLQDAARR